MGAYLPKPVTEKDSINGYLYVNGQKCPYGVTVMQGWRVSMEDTYCVLTEFDGTVPLLAIFDGHGGKEVSVYCSRHIPELIKATKSYQNGDISHGISEAFMSCDKHLLTEEAIREMKEIAESEMPTIETDSDDDESDDEIDKLVAEAGMPIENVLMSCVGNKDLVKNLMDLANKNLQKSEDTSGISNDVEVKPRKFRVYEKFFQELVMQDGPLSKELDEIIEEGTYSSTSSSSEEEEEEEEDDDDDEIETEKEEEEIKNDEENDKQFNEGNSVDSNEEETEMTLIRRKRTRTEDCKDSKNKRLHIEEDDGEDFFESEGHESGTTAVVCIIRDNQITVGNAGDSRCVLCSNGEAVDLSLDHKPLDPIELARIEKAGGHVDEDLRVDGGLNLSRAIGDHMYKKNKSLPLEEQMITALPDIHTRNISPEDEFIVLASDGIWNSMDSQEVVDFIRNRLLGFPQEEVALTSICEKLCDTCLSENTDNDGTGCDNMSIIVSLLKPLKNFNNINSK